MKLKCSAGHEYDTNRVTALGNPREGDRCPMELSYDRIHGSRYCRRKLKQAVEVIAIQRNGEWTWKMIGEQTMESSREFRSEADAIKDGCKIAKSCGLVCLPNVNVDTSPPQ